MEFYLFDIKIRIEYSFVLMISFAVLFSAENLVNLLLFSMCHEAGHLIALILCGARADSLTFSYYGLALKYSSALPRLRELIVIAAGPLVNLILYCVFRDDVNFVLFVLNMLPVYPLDGGRILRLYSYKISKIISLIFLIFLIVLSLFLIVYYKSYSLLLICVYLAVYSINY